jgi:hypothetical protein
MAQPTNIRTTCSGCRINVTLFPRDAKVTALIPSNGKRGSLHVPAHMVSSDLYGDEDLYEWDCPACEHADSFDPNA